MRLPSSRTASWWGTGLVLALLVASLCVPIQAYAATGFITGHVYGPDGATGAPSVLVSVWQKVGSSWQIVGQTQTLPSPWAGYYSVAGLQPGNYSLGFDTWLAPQFAFTYFPGGVSDLADPGVGSVGVTSGGTTTIDQTLQPAGHIIGTVTDASTHQPVAGMTIYATRLLSDGTWSQQELLTPVTDALGSFGLDGLPSGTYEVGYGPYDSYHQSYLTGQVMQIAVGSGQTVHLLNQQVPPGPYYVDDPASGVEVSFGSVTGGIPTVNVTPIAAQSPPSGFQLNGSAYDIQVTNAQYSGNVKVTVPYTPGSLSLAQQQGLKLYHFDTGSASWQDITTAVDTANHTVSGVTTSLSPFAVLAPAGPAVVSSTPASSSWSLALLALIGLGITGIGMRSDWLSRQ